MGQILLMPPRAGAGRREAGWAPPAGRGDPSAAARGVLLALALSSLAWIAIALLVPRLW